MEEGLARLGLVIDEGALGKMVEFAFLLWEGRRLYRCVSQSDLEEIAILHVLDSATGLLALRGPGRLADIGSGAGLPGLPLAIADPSIGALLLEPKRKHCQFLERALGILRLEGRVCVLPLRAEEAGRDEALRESFDLATARAVAPLPVVLEYALPLLKIGGRFVAYKGLRWKEEKEAGETAAEVLGGRLKEVMEFELPAVGRKRALVVFEKEWPTPPCYPRRPGMPGKRPLPR